MAIKCKKRTQRFNSEFYAFEVFKGEIRIPLNNILVFQGNQRVLEEQRQTK
jgi:hypothetical protein